MALVVDDIPIHLVNRKNDTQRQRVVNVPADAQAEQLIWDWLPSRLNYASAEMLGAQWIRGCDVLVQSFGAASVAPGVRTLAGIAEPMEVWDGKHFSKRVDVVETYIDLPSASTGLEAYVIAVQADGTSAEGGKVIAQRVTREALIAAKGETFYYAPPEATLDLMVPLALVLIGPAIAGFPYGTLEALTDIRQPRRGFMVAYKLSPWKIPFAGYLPDESAVGNHSELSDQEDAVQWIELNGRKRFPLGPEGRFHGKPGQAVQTDNPMGIWMFLPRGFELELGLTCEVRGRNTLRVTPLIDGVDLASDGEDSQLFEVATQIKPKQGESVQRSISITSVVPNPIPGVHFITWGVQGSGQFDKGRNFAPEDPNPTAYVELSKIQVRARLIKAIDEQGFIRGSFT
jgi:hypothetical protein